jgi:cyanophycin synthetase
MEFGRIWVLRGPNLWAGCPVIEVELNLGEHVSFSPGSTDSPFRAHLAAWLGPQEPALEASATLADVLLLLTQELQRLAGSTAIFGHVRSTPRPGWYRVVFSYEEDALARACLQAAYRLTMAVLRGEPTDWDAQVTAVRQLSQEVRLGPSTRCIVDACRARGIPTRRLNEGSLVQLGWGVRQKRIWTAETDDTPAIAEVIAQDKQLTRHLLQSVGVPIPDGRPVTNAEDAWAAAEEIGPPVVVKPQYGNQGRGVATNLTTREQVVKAYAAAREISSFIVVEKFVPGLDHRLLVVGGKLAAAALREPAHVIGDGRATIAELIAVVNRDPRRSDGHATALSWIKIDAIGLEVLAEQGFAPDSVPPGGQRVLIRRNANLSTGGTATDVTDRVHPEVAAHAIDAARAVGLDIAGVDIVAADISRPLSEQDGAAVEVNAGPGLRMHLEPSAGSPRPVGRAIVNALFPPGTTGRIPVAAVSGVNGKTTTTRLLAHLLRTAGVYVGMTCTDGIYLDGRRTETRDCSGPQSARSVLLNPRVDTAVLETARGGILREGLGFDRCDVAIVTNIGKGDHLGLRGIETLDELALVKEVVVRAVAPTGHAILNAADPRVAAMAPACPGRVLFFAHDSEHPILARHRAAGGRAALARAGKLLLTDGGSEEVLLDQQDIPFAHHGIPFQVENALAAAAAAWCLGFTLETIRAGLRTFTGSAEQVPGRFNVLEAGEATVIVDYAHNPSAVTALVTALEVFPHPYRTLVFSGCNRRDIDLIEMGEEAGHAFDRVVLYADWGHSGRSDGELNTVLRQGLQRGHRVRDVVETPTEREALEMALHSLRPGELLVIGVEAIEDSLAFVQAHLSATACGLARER